MRNEALKNDGATVDEFTSPDLALWDTTRYTDWQKVLIGGTAKYTDAQASLSGGNESTQFVIGAGYHRETTVFPDPGANTRASVHFNVTNSSFNNKLKLVLSGNYSLNDAGIIPNDFTSMIGALPPVAPALYNEDGTLNYSQPWSTADFLNPFASLLSKYTGKTNNLVSNVALSYSILNGLEFKTSAGYTATFIDEIITFPSTAYNPAWNISSGSSTFSRVNNKSWIVEPQLSYSTRQNVMSKISFLIGTTVQEQQTMNENLFATGFSSDALLKNIAAASSITPSGYQKTQYKYNALFGRINYTYAGKYIINLTGRRDGSSRFGPDKQFANFGAAGAAWIFSEEKAFAESLRFMSFGKLRSSYGVTGSDQIRDYRFMDLFRTTTYPYQEIQGYYASSLFNPDLAWEKNKKLEAGLELGFLNNRILLSASYYRNRSSNQLVGYPLPGITGFLTIDRNLAATVQNSGVELSLNTINVKTKDFSWSSSLNITFARNKLVSFPDLQKTGYRFSYLVGEPLNIARLNHLAGVDPATGQYQFTDSAGNITLDPLPTDRTVVLSLDPKYYGGLQNSFQFKQFTVDFLLEFTKQINRNGLSGFLPGYYGVNQPVAVLDRWRKPGDINTLQRYNHDGSLYSSYEYATNSDQAYSDASFIRLKNLSLSYEFPVQLKDRLNLDNLRIYIQCQNLFTITHYKGMDPETLGNAVLPPLRVITGGFQITF